MSSQPDWKTFEELATEIQRELAPDAVVTPNAKLPGRRSKVQRQIDILVEQKVGQYDVRVVIDCKDYKVPVDLKEVETVIGLVDDVGANKGAIIAAKGFTEGAKARAKEAGIDLYGVIDTAKHKWGSYITVPAVTRDWRLGSWNMRISCFGFGKLKRQDMRYLPILRSDGSLIDYACNLVLNWWEDGMLPKQKGIHSDIPLTAEATYLKTDELLFPVTLTFSVEVYEVFHFGQIGLTEFRGFKNEIQERVITNGFTTEKFDFEKIGKEWQKIDSLDQLAVKPLVTLGVSTNYPRYTGNIEK